MRLCQLTGFGIKAASHTAPEKFENAALFLLLHLLSTIIRHANPSR